MAYSDAQKEATARYNKKAYDRINLIVRKGKRKRIAEYAWSQQALQLQREAQKLEKQTRSREQREEEKQRRFTCRQQKRKEKHRGK